MTDVVIAGGGPAGAFAALLLARAGVRVRVFERARFPRPKLCGDTLNPGALALLARHLDVAPLVAMSGGIDGMLLTGPGGARVRGHYAAGQRGRAVTRAHLDQWLIEQAVVAGAQVDEGVSVTAIADVGSRPATARRGVRLRWRDGRTGTHETTVVIGADGRRSRLAVGLGLTRQPVRPRRWAIGAYFTGVHGLTTAGEMHVRHGYYIGVAPLPGGMANACLVLPHRSGDSRLPPPDRLLADRLAADAELGSRFADARPLGPSMVLGPLAVDGLAAGAPGLLLAGDAAGFVDPMTGDGIRFALAGAELAVEVALDVLAGRRPVATAHRTLAARRQAVFGAKWRFNRALRALVDVPAAVGVAATASRLAPALFQSVIRYAGDCGVAAQRAAPRVEALTA